MVLGRVPAKQTPVLLWLTLHPRLVERREEENRLEGIYLVNCFTGDSHLVQL